MNHKYLKQLLLALLLLFIPFVLYHIFFTIPENRAQEIEKLEENLCKQVNKLEPYVVRIPVIDTQIDNIERTISVIEERQAKLYDLITELLNKKDLTTAVK